MQPQYLSVTANGTTLVNAIKTLDTWANPFNVGVALLFSGAAASATVQYTLEDVNEQTGVYPNPNGTTSPTWFTLIAATGSNSTGTLTSPATALRLQTSAGTGVVTAAIVQAGGGQ